MTPEKTWTTTLEQLNESQFLVTFDDLSAQPLLVDDSVMFGREGSATTVQVLSAAIGNGLAASFLLSFRNAGLEPRKLTAEVRVTGSEESGRCKLTGIRVSLKPEFDEFMLGKVGHCLEQFEEESTLFAGVHQSIDFQMEVSPILATRAAAHTHVA
ncbi:MAG: hypothetical protein AB1898_03235 [Acidobacteriota bacterium]